VGLARYFLGPRCVYVILYGIAEARGYPMSPVKAELITALILIALAVLIGRISVLCWAGHHLTSPSHTNGDNCLSGAVREKRIGDLTRTGLPS
jgi:hypothetical protein